MWTAAQISCFWSYICLFFFFFKQNTTNFTSYEMHSVKTGNNNRVVTFRQQKWWPQKVTSTPSWPMTATASLLIDARDTVWISISTKYHTSSNRREISLGKITLILSQLWPEKRSYKPTLREQKHFIWDYFLK